MNRVFRVNQLIRKELSRLVSRGIDFPEDVLVTVTKVETTANLIDAKIYVSVLPEDQTSRIMKILKSQIYSLQQKLNKRLNMRPLPKIIFVEERATKEAGRVEEILEEIRQKK